MSRMTALLVLLAVSMESAMPQQTSSAPRPRLREVGVRVGVMSPGPLNAITDVAGVAATGRGKTVEALPVERVVEILKRHGMIKK